MSGGGGVPLKVNLSYCFYSILTRCIFKYAPNYAPACDVLNLLTRALNPDTALRKVFLYAWVLFIPLLAHGYGALGRESEYLSL